MKDYEVKRRFIKFRAEGKSYDEICRELSISKGTCTKWNKDLESAIQEFKSKQIEELHEGYYLMRSQRIEALAKKVSKLEEEMDKRDLSEVSVKDLWRLHSQYYGLLKNEVIELKDEKPERSLNAMLLDVELAERLAQPNVIFLDEDLEVKLSHLDTIRSMISRLDGGEDLTDAMREQYREAVCEVNSIYRRYGLNWRVDIFFDLIPRRDQALFAEVVKAMRDLEKKMAGKSLVLKDSISDRDRRMYLKTMQLRSLFLSNYGFSADDLDGMDSQRVPNFTESGRNLLEELIEASRMPELTDEADTAEEGPVTDSE